MMNTWGDRSQDSRVCEEFMLKEIEAGAKLGVDIIQIDDGWQKGVTVNSKARKSSIWEGFYAADPDFWTVHPQRFPHGLKPLVKNAAAHGIRFGLWFAPDSSHEFANWRRDVDTILNLHRMYGISSFKLDSVNLLSKKAETNYLNFLTAVERESNNRIALNLDCTAQNRQGYVMWKQFGSLFGVLDECFDHLMMTRHNLLERREIRWVAAYRHLRCLNQFVGYTSKSRNYYDNRLVTSLNNLLDIQNTVNRTYGCSTKF